MKINKNIPTFTLDKIAQILNEKKNWHKKREEKESGRRQRKEKGKCRSVIPSGEWWQDETHCQDEVRKTTSVLHSYYWEAMDLRLLMKKESFSHPWSVRFLGTLPDRFVHPSWQSVIKDTDRKKDTECGKCRKRKKKQKTEKDTERGKTIQKVETKIQKAGKKYRKREKIQKVGKDTESRKEINNMENTSGKKKQKAEKDTECGKTIQKEEKTYKYRKWKKTESGKRYRKQKKDTENRKKYTEIRKDTDSGKRYRKRKKIQKVKKKIQKVEKDTESGKRYRKQKTGTESRKEREKQEKAGQSSHQESGQILTTNTQQLCKVCLYFIVLDSEKSETHQHPNNPGRITITILAESQSRSNSQSWHKRFPLRTITRLQLDSLSPYCYLWPVLKIPSPPENRLPLRASQSPQPFLA